MPFSILNSKFFLSLCITAAVLACFLLYYPKWSFQNWVNTYKYSVCNDSKMESDRKLSDAEQQRLHFESMSEIRRSAIKQESGLPALQMYLVPEITCSTAVRVGAVGDGGKWVCNPWRARNDCIIYSFGVSGDTSFENGMFELTRRRCNIYSFDVGPQKGELFQSFNGKFNKWRISAVTDEHKSEWAILDIARHFSHDHIDFMKMDIEGGEFSSLPPVLNSQFAINGKICQIFIELHSDVGAWKQLLEQLQKSGFLMFYKEGNAFCPSCFEYSYIHKACLKTFGIDYLVFNKNF